MKFTLFRWTFLFLLFGFLTAVLINCEELDKLPLIGTPEEEQNLELALAAVALASVPGSGGCATNIDGSHFLDIPFINLTTSQQTVPLDGFSYDGIVLMSGLAAGDRMLATNTGLNCAGLVLRGATCPQELTDVAYPDGVEYSATVLSGTEIEYTFPNGGNFSFYVTCVMSSPGMQVQKL